MYLPYALADHSGWLYTATAQHLVKRDQEYLLPKPVIVLLIMFGAGFVVCMGFAVHSAFGFGRNANVPKPMTNAQAEYMAEVRVRNMDALARAGAPAARRQYDSGY